jgi:hypothetical protein
LAADLGRQAIRFQSFFAFTHICSCFVHALVLA